MPQSIQSAAPSLQQIKSHIGSLENSSTSEFKEPLKAPGNWQRLLCALYSRGLNVGARGSEAFNAIATYNGKVLERKQMLEGLRSHLERLGTQDELKSASNMTRLLKTNNFWQALNTVTEKAIKVERQQYIDQQRAILCAARSEQTITNFLQKSTHDSRQGDLVFRRNFSDACRLMYSASYESATLTSEQLHAVLHHVKEASLG